jgi:hypothetical protein
VKVGGLALFEARGFNTPYSIGSDFFSAKMPGALTAGLGPVPFATPEGGTSLATAYRNPRQRDDYRLGATGRLELDARTQTGFSTLRALIRIDSFFGSSANPQTDALNQLNNTGPAAVQVNNKRLRRASPRATRVLGVGSMGASSWHARAGHSLPRRRSRARSHGTAEPADPLTLPSAPASTGILRSRLPVGPKIAFERSFVTG